MLRDMTNGDGYAALEQEAKERKGEITVKWCQKPAL